MERKDILKSPAFWTSRIQTALYRCAYKFMEQSGKNRSQLASHLGVSRGYVTQLLNGDYDHKLSKLAELSLAFGFVPVLDFVPVDEYIAMDEVRSKNRWQQKPYVNETVWCSNLTGIVDDAYETPNYVEFKSVA